MGNKSDLTEFPSLYYFAKLKVNGKHDFSFITLIWSHWHELNTYSKEFCIHAYACNASWKSPYYCII